MPCHELCVSQPCYSCPVQMIVLFDWAPACRLDVYDKIWKMERTLRLLEGLGCAPTKSSANLYSLLLRALSRQGTRRSTEKALGVIKELEVCAALCVWSGAARIRILHYAVIIALVHMCVLACSGSEAQIADAAPHMHGHGASPSPGGACAGAASDLLMRRMQSRCRPAPPGSDPLLAPCSPSVWTPAHVRRQSACGGCTGGRRHQLVPLCAWHPHLHRRPE